MCQNLNIFCVENIEISLYAQARQSLLLLTQGNIYNRLRFLNKYLMFLEEINEQIGQNFWLPDIWFFEQGKKQYMVKWTFLELNEQKEQFNHDSLYDISFNLLNFKNPLIQHM